MIDYQLCGFRFHPQATVRGVEPPCRAWQMAPQECMCGLNILVCFCYLEKKTLLATGHKVFDVI